VDHVAVVHEATDLRHDRHRERIPLGHHLTGLDARAVLDRQACTVLEAIALALATDVVDQDELALAIHDHPVIFTLHDVDVVELDGALVAGLEARLLRPDLTDATDVERTHRQLRTGLADRLRGDHTDRLADVHHVTASEV